MPGAVLSSQDVAANSRDSVPALVRLNIIKESVVINAINKLDANEVPLSHPPEKKKQKQKINSVGEEKL